MHNIAFTPSAGCDRVGVQVLCGRPPDVGVHAGASLYTRVMCVVTLLMRFAVWLWVGSLCLLHTFNVMTFGLISLGPHCF